MGHPAKAHLSTEMCGEESGSSFARRPTHAMKLHEWGTRPLAF
jgi:hypothetical protein